MPISWPWKTGRPWWPLWVIRAMALPGRSSRKTSKALRLVLGPSTWRSPLSMISSISSWSFSPSAPTSANPAAKTTANLALAATASRRMGSGSPTRMATRSSRSVDVGQGLGAGPARDFAAVGVDVVDRGPALLGPDGDLLGQRRVRAGVGVRRPDHGDPLGAEERIEVDLAEGDRPARDVEQLIPVGAGAVTGSVPALVVPAMSLPCAHRRTGGFRRDIAPRPSPGRLRWRCGIPVAGRPLTPSPYMTFVSVSISRQAPVPAPGAELWVARPSRYGM